MAVGGAMGRVVLLVVLLGAMAEARSAEQKPKVVVVGAGMAGVTAATKLIHNGIDDVTIVEAQNYIGGRIMATEWEGNVVDLGAQYIHGQRGNPLFRIARKLGRIPPDQRFRRSADLYGETDLLETSDKQKTPDDTADKLLRSRRQALGDYDDEEDDDTFGALYGAPDVYYTSKQTTVQPRKINKLLRRLRITLGEGDEDDYDYDDEEDKYEIHEAVSVKSKLMETYNEFIEEQDPGQADLEIYKAALGYQMTFDCGDSGVDDLSQISYVLRDEHIDLPGNRYTEVKGGMVSVMKALADTLPAGVVRLNTPVAKVSWGYGDGDDELPVRVTLENGEVLEADHVIVTVSMGVLKALHEQMFEPRLPLPTRHLIERIGFQGIGKVFLFWDQPFWGNTVSYEFLWLDSATPVISSDKSKKKNINGQPWWYGIYSVGTWRTLPNALEVFMPPSMTDASETLEDQEVSDVIVELMQWFLPHLTIPKPSKIIRTQWIHNQYVRGTYSHYSTKLRWSDMDLLDGLIPEEAEDNDLRLLLAGESFSREYMSTAHAAYTSGERQADAILDYHGYDVEEEILDLIPRPDDDFF